MSWEGAPHSKIHIYFRQNHGPSIHVPGKSLRKRGRESGRENRGTTYANITFFKRIVDGTYHWKFLRPACNHFPVWNFGLIPTLCFEARVFLVHLWCYTYSPSAISSLAKWYSYAEAKLGISNMLSECSKMSWHLCDGKTIITIQLILMIIY